MLTALLQSWCVVIRSDRLGLTLHVQTQAEEMCPDDASIRVHPIIEYLGGEVAQAGQAQGGLDLFSLDIGTVEEWCYEATENCPTETGVIHASDLRPYLGRIDPKFRWWLPPAPHGSTFRDAGA